MLALMVGWTALLVTYAPVKSAVAADNWLLGMSVLLTGASFAAAVRRLAGTL